MPSTYIAVVAAEFLVTAASMRVVTKAPTTSAAAIDTTPPAKRNRRANDCCLHRSIVRDNLFSRHDYNAQEVLQRVAASMAGALEGEKAEMTRL